MGGRTSREENEQASSPFKYPRRIGISYETAAELLHEKRKGFENTLDGQQYSLVKTVPDFLLQLQPPARLDFCILGNGIPSKSKC